MQADSKHVIVTGASRGIGRALVLWLTGNGHRVTALARSEAPLLTLGREAGPLVSVHAVDLASPKKLDRFAASLSHPVDAVVHNAGTLINKPFDRLTDDDWQQMWDVNVMGIVRLTRALLPHMNRNAHNVLISSMGGFQGSSKYPGLSGYAATKGAVAILAECLAVELASRDIRTNALCLGAVQTEMLAEAFPGYTAPVKPEQMAAFIGRFALEHHQVLNGKVIPAALSNP